MPATVVRLTFTGDSSGVARPLLALFGAVILSMQPSHAVASYAIYVGKNLTADGSVFLGGSGDEVSSHWIEVVPARDHAAGSTIRVGVDATANMPGEYIDIPLDFRGHPDFMGSANFVSFAIEQGWYEPDAGLPFNVTAVYRTAEVRWPRNEIEAELRQSAPISLREMLDVVRDPRISKDSTGYGQVAALRHGQRAELHTLWIAATGSVTTPFTPFRIGVETIPPSFGKHRYLTKGEATCFVTRDWQIQEATEFAYRTFKRLMYFTCDHPEKFLPEVTEALTAFEDRLIAEHGIVDETALALFDADRDDLAATYLTQYSSAAAMEALRLGNALLGSIEERTRLIYGLRQPQTDEISRLDYQMVTCRGDDQQPP